MPRRLKVQTKEMGFLELLLIYCPGDCWEAAWRPLQRTAVGDLFTQTTKAVMDHALWGYSKPLVDSLGIPPAGALRKIPYQQCGLRGHCPFYAAKDCCPQGRNLPHCFRPEGQLSEEAQTLVYEAIQLWREGVYIAVVKEPLDAG